MSARKRSGRPSRRGSTRRSTNLKRRSAAPGNGGARPERLFASRCPVLLVRRLRGRLGRMDDAARRGVLAGQGRAARCRGADRRMGRPAGLYAAGADLPVAAAPAMPRREPVSVPEGSKLTVRVVSREAAEVTLASKSGVAALSPDGGKPLRRIGRRDPQLRDGARPRRDGRRQARRRAPPPTR